LAVVIDYVIGGENGIAEPLVDNQLSAVGGESGEIGGDGVVDAGGLVRISRGTIEVNIHRSEVLDEGMHEVIAKGHGAQRCIDGVRDAGLGCSQLPDPPAHVRNAGIERPG